MLFSLNIAFSLSAQSALPIYTSKAYSVYPDKVTQGNYSAKVISSVEMTSDYRSPVADKHSNEIEFKFSINLRDNEMAVGKNHSVTLHPVGGKCVTSAVFGAQEEIKSDVFQNGENLPKNTEWTIKLDMRDVLKSFKEKGYFTLFNGDKIYEQDFKSVYVAGNTAPLSWDFHNLFKMPELQLKDPDGDGIYETTLMLNTAEDKNKMTLSHWKLSKNVSAFPQYKSEYPISDAIYNLALEEMENAVEKDSTLRTGKEWAGVWTRDVSYSIILSMAYMQPKVAKNSLMRKVKDGKIIQDTGTGGAYPVSTDRMIWAVAAWEIYKTTGDQNWLEIVYPIVKKSIEQDIKNVYDPKTGLAKGESSFLDWREQTYPRWMQSADIYESENLGTNAVHYQANTVLAKMAEILNKKETAEKHRKIAENIKKAINKYLWMENYGYYGQYIYGRNYKFISPRSEALGEALCVLFNVANSEKQREIISNVPVMDYGISCIYPQIPDIPPYHNNAVWPFVQTYWALASAKTGNEPSVMESFASIYRAAALFLTNKENFVADTGDFAGTQINSSNMLWSLSGNLALVHKILFGIEFGTDSLKFHPFVPETLKGKRSLSNFRYRNTVLNIEMEGFGNKIKSIEIDGVKSTRAAISYRLSGTHSISIILADNALTEKKINKTDHYITPETPVTSYTNGVLSWNKIAGAKNYIILKNGVNQKQTSETSVKIPAKGYAEYQVIALDEKQVQSFASEPVVVSNKKLTKVYDAENSNQPFDNKYKDFQGKGYVETSKTRNTIVKIPITVSSNGKYAITVRYANGNGPVNTDNKCAIRTLKIDGKSYGTIVLPQRGANEWSNWGYSNRCHADLPKGKHTLEIVFDSLNENMNSDINQALIDSVILYKIE